MDPTYPPSQPGPDVPQPAGEPAPTQPPAAAPQPFGAPPFGEPAAPGAVPPGAVPPGSVPPTYGTAADWAAPPPPKRSRFGRRSIGGGVVGIVVVIALLVASSLLPNDKGKIVFTTDTLQTGTSHSCAVNHQVTSVTAGTHVYYRAIFKHKMGSDALTLEVAKDGVSLDKESLDTSVTNGLDCLSIVDDLAILPVGTYKFTISSPSGTEAEGTLTVK